MDLTKLSYFVAAAECGSFTAAARREYTSQPNISKQMSALEEEMGTKLFVRENRSVRLTPAGEYLFEQVRELPERLNRVFETTRAIGRSGTGELTVGLLTGQSLSGALIDRFRRFTERWPGLHYTLERASFRDLRDALHSFRYDMIITLSFDVETEPELAMATIKHQSTALFVSRMTPLTEGKTLGDLPFIAISPKESYGGYNQLLRFGEQHGFQPNIVRLADSLDSLLFYVEAGVGVTLLDRNTRLEQDRNICATPLPDSEPSDLVAVWLRSNTNPNISRMVECLCAPEDEMQS